MLLISQKFDLSKVKPSELDFEAPFTLTMQQDTQCHVCVDGVLLTGLHYVVP